ncbi:hypothetical protein JW926_03750 [Candidatus Sumerlaeota bacterium]|nr:hypothetical protein [Candidatus Sumerlaeota bacterium]
MRKIRYVCLFMLFLLAPLWIYADTTVDPVFKFSWGPNIGFMNWQADITNGVKFDNTDSLSGYIWSANCGWINVGNDLSLKGFKYANDSPDDYGVNISGEDANFYYLSGYAWSPNIGWINFDADSDFDTRFGIDTVPRITKSNGVLQGYAWGANCGWLPLNSGGSIQVDLDGGSIPTESTGWMLR